MSDFNVFLIDESIRHAALEMWEMNNEISDGWIPSNSFTLRR